MSAPVGGRFDAIVIGGGHNGLVTAAILAAAGRRTVVLEARPDLGGCAVTEEVWPGFRVDTGAHHVGPIDPVVSRELDLDRAGLSLVDADPCVVSLLGDRTPLTLWRDPAATAESIRPFSTRDAARWADFAEAMSSAARALAVLYDADPPRVAGAEARDLWELVRLGGRLARIGRAEAVELMRLLPMTIEELLDEWFESAALKGTLAAEGVRGIFQGPMAAGTAFVFLHGLAGGDTVVRSRRWVAGGVGGLAAAIGEIARARGVDVRTGVRVSRILIRDGIATGVELEGGDIIEAPVIASSAAPRHTFLSLMSPLELSPDFVRQIRNIRYRGGLAKVNLGVERLPKIEPPGSVLSVAPDIEYIERAYDDAKYGRVSANPVLDVLVPSRLGPAQAPSGHHVVSVIAQYAPYRLADGVWDDATREALGDRIVATLDRHLPGLADAIIHRQVLMPVDLEERFGLPEGNVNHGEMTLDQTFIGRPVPGWARYRTPVEGVFLCGAGAHPGGGITGSPGYRAARAILATAAGRRR